MLLGADTKILVLASLRLFAVVTLNHQSSTSSLASSFPKWVSSSVCTWTLLATKLLALAWASLFQCGYMLTPASVQQVHGDQLANLSPRLHLRARRQTRFRPADPNRCRTPQPWPQSISTHAVRKKSSLSPPHGKIHIAAITGYSRTMRSVAEQYHYRPN